jgi:hypothetical protein
MKLFGRHPYDRTADVAIEIEVSDTKPTNVITLGWEGILAARKAMEANPPMLRIIGPMKPTDKTPTVESQALLGAIWDFKGLPFVPGGSPRPAANFSVWRDANGCLHVYRAASECRNGYVMNYAETDSAMASGRTEYS